MDDRYLQHSDLTMPPGKTFSSTGINDAPWVGPYVRDLSLATQDYHAANLLTRVDRDTVRLVEQEENEGRVVRIEQTAPSFGQRGHVTAVYSQWAPRRTCWAPLPKPSLNRRRSSLRSAHDG